MNRSKLRSAALAVVFAVGFTALGAGSALAVQGHMLSARSYLNSAWGQLNMATANKNGHRLAAMHLITQAIQEVNWGINAGEQ